MLRRTARKFFYQENDKMFICCLQNGKSFLRNSCFILSFKDYTNPFGPTDLFCTCGAKDGVKFGLQISCPLCFNYFIFK